MKQVHILLINCNDAKGLIAAITQVIFAMDLNIEVMREFVEEETNRFFMRCEFSGEVDADALHAMLRERLPQDSYIVINPKSKKDIVIMATKEHHCLSDLLTRFYFNELSANVKAVICNHPNLESFVKNFGVPFHHISHENRTKHEFEVEILKVLGNYKPDYIILAKFMRILSPDFVSKYENRIINIHHSFLPAFIGANPYMQAFHRGVKLIGATAHIVNNQLDEGPILTQKVIEVGHNFNAKKLVETGHEVEKQVLAEACKLMFEDKVFVSGNKTIILK
ncbi:MAG TPA: formyltetrahydrofolate deformylase [Cytophagales bacterium]|nr:formyltetrahydrofolate deformylase [Cytophagales bacterium]